MPFDPSSREAEAQAEIAATRQRRGVVPALLAGFVLVLSSGPLLELGAALGGRSAVSARFPDLPDLDALFAEVELRFDERSALVETVRPTAQTLLTRLAHYGNERAIVGRDGWLFFRDDVEHLVSRRPAASFAGDPRAAIVGFRNQLAERGIGLVVVPAPLKPTVHPAKLAGAAAAPPPVRRTGERELLAALDDEGIELLDLADRFSRQAALSPLYLATDTHWRPEAVEIAARELALRLRDRFELPPGDSGLRGGDADRRSALGDTAAMLDLPGGAHSSIETVEALPVTAPAESFAEVLLLGDSFAAIYSSPDLGWGARAGLADRLAAQLGLTVDRILRNAGGASATRQAFADAWRRDPARFASLRVVVWQFAARELSQGEWRDVALP